MTNLNQVAPGCCGGGPFALTAVALAPLAALVALVLDGVGDPLRVLVATTGVLAALVQFTGLIRWPFLVPYLARLDADPDTSPATSEAVDVVFQAFNRYLGVAVGEHLGYLFTGAWTVLVGAALTQTTITPTWLGIPGIVIGAVLMLSSCLADAGEVMPPKTTYFDPKPCAGIFLRP